jgi:hypothetical protein
VATEPFSTIQALVAGDSLVVPLGDEITFFDVKPLFRMTVVFARRVGAMGLCFSHKKASN